MLGQGTGRGRTTLWPLGGQRANAWQWPTSWTGLTQSIPTAFKEWALADVAPGRLVPWLPVAFGSGIALYFAAEREPSAWVAAALVLACVVCALLLRRRPVAFPLALAFAAIAAGFAVATLRSATIAHPVINGIKSEPDQNLAINLNVSPGYIIDLARDPREVAIGTSNLPNSDARPKQ